MGIIKRQGIKKTIVTYFGVGIGIISTLFIYPLDLKTYGFVQFLISTAMFIVPFATLGIPSLIIRFFPDFKNEENGHNGFLGFILASIILALLVFLFLAFVLQPHFYKGLGALGFDVLLFSENLSTILVLCFLFALSGALVNHISNFRRVVVPAIFDNLLVKVAIPVLILLLFYGVFPDNFIKPYLTTLYIFIVLALLLYLYFLGQLKFKINLPSFKRPVLAEMSNYALYGILGSIGGVIAFRIDSIMVASLIDLKSNGIYNIALFMANAIAIPYVSISNITSPIIASAWKENDKREIEMIYQKSSLVLFIVGLFLLLLVWSAVDDIFRLTPRYDELILGKYVLLFLGIGKVIDMTTGLNSQIIGYSHLFRFNLVAILSLAVINVLTNYALIPKYQMMGAAMATALSLMLFNLVKFIFIWVKFKMQPFTWASAKVLLIAAIAYGVVLWIPISSYPLVNIFIKTVIVSLFFGLPILYFNISPDITNMAIQGREKIMDWLRIK